MISARRSFLNWNEALKAFTRGLKAQVESDKPLAGLNTFGTGGSARLFAEVKNSEELAQLVKIAHENNVPYFMLGGGSNLLISDQGYDGLVIKNSILGLSAESEIVTAGAGEKLEDLVHFAADNGLAGLEFATGIWGTVGGAIHGNAGAYGADISAVMVSAQLVDEYGNIRDEELPYFEFHYRYSKLKKTHEFVTRAKFALKKGTHDLIQARISEIMDLRTDKLPKDEKSAGCFFKNILDARMEYGKLPAGKLLEEIGAKEIHFGGAAIFSKHANIIINTGSATSTDIWKLASILKMKVKEKFGIELQEEITYLGPF